MGDLKKSVQFISDGFDERRRAIGNVLSEMKQLKKENLHLKESYHARKQTKQLRAQGKRKKLSGYWDYKTGRKVQNNGSKIIATLEVDEILDVYRINAKDDSPILIKF